MKLSRREKKELCRREKYWLREKEQAEIERGKIQVPQLEKPVAEFLSGSVVLQVWKKRSKHDREYYCISVSRYRTNGLSFWHSEYLFPSDIKDAVNTFHKFLGEFHRLGKF